MSVNPMKAAQSGWQFIATVTARIFLFISCSQPAEGPGSEGAGGGRGSSEPLRATITRFIDKELFFSPLPHPPHCKARDRGGHIWLQVIVLDTKCSEALAKAINTADNQPCRTRTRQRPAARVHYFRRSKSKCFRRFHRVTVSSPPSPAITCNSSPKAAPEKASCGWVKS